jgi:hypothetical protein
MFSATLADMRQRQLAGVSKERKVAIGEESRSRADLRQRGLYTVAELRRNLRL